LLPRITTQVLTGNQSSIVLQVRTKPTAPMCTVSRRDGWQENLTLRAIRNLHWNGMQDAVPSTKLDFHENILQDLHFLLFFEVKSAIYSRFISVSGNPRNGFSGV
jgi:hypothetical protein